MFTDRKLISAGEFKQRCLAFLDEVEATHREYVVTKRGRPVARVVAITEDRDKEAEILAALRGRGRMLVEEAEFLRPSTAAAGWNLGDRD